MKEFCNEITMFLDMYSPKYGNSDFINNNYFVDFGLASDDENIHIYVFRLPGASRGKVLVEQSTGKIITAEAYGDFQITYPYLIPYTELTEKLQRFVGMNWNRLNHVERK